MLRIPLVLHPTQRGTTVNGHLTISVKSVRARDQYVRAYLNGQLFGVGKK